MCGAKHRQAGLGKYILQMASQAPQKSDRCTLVLPRVKKILSTTFAYGKHMLRPKQAPGQAPDVALPQRNQSPACKPQAGRCALCETRRLPCAPTTFYDFLVLGSGMARLTFSLATVKSRT